MPEGNGRLTKNAIDLLKKRYFNKEYNETLWCQLADRVASAVADAEGSETQKAYWSKQFFDQIYNLKFIPSTPCLINADKNNPGQLSSCFITDLKTISNQSIRRMANVLRFFKNGGVGFDISVLRPEIPPLKLLKDTQLAPLVYGNL